MPQYKDLNGKAAMAGWILTETHVTTLPGGKGGGKEIAGAHVTKVEKTVAAWAAYLEEKGKAEAAKPPPPPEPASLGDLVVAARRRVADERLRADVAENERYGNAAAKYREHLEK